MRFMYSSLDYKLLPIMTATKVINTSYPDWPFGENVVAIMEKFFKRYYETVFGMNLDSYSEAQQKILTALREYGISVKEIGIDVEMLDEIQNRLKTRYSTYDVLNAIRDLANTTIRNKSVFRYIKARYFL